MRQERGTTRQRFMWGRLRGRSGGDPVFARNYHAMYLPTLVRQHIANFESKKYRPSSVHQRWPATYPVSSSDASFWTWWNITSELGGFLTPSITSSHLPPLHQGPPITTGLLKLLRKAGAKYRATMLLWWLEGALQVFYFTVSPDLPNYCTSIIIHLHCMLGGVEEHM